MTCNYLKVSIKKFDNIIKLGKDELDNLYCRNSVYKINCNDCNFCDMGQT